MANDGPPLMFVKSFGSLRPANPAAEEALAALLPDRAVRVRITGTRGNTRRNALYWVAMGVAAPILSESTDGDALTSRLLHRILKDRYGLVPTITLKSGYQIKDWDAASTAFDKMPENERAAFIDWALRTVSKWIGVTIEVLMDEARAAGGAAI